MTAEQWFVLGAGFSVLVAWALTEATYRLQARVVTRAARRMTERTDR